MDLNNFKIAGSADKLAGFKLQNGRLIKLRWYYIGVLSFSALISSIIAGVPSPAARLYPVLFLAVFLINTFFYLINRFGRLGLKGCYALMIVQLTLDISVASFLTYAQGGLLARTTIFYAIPIIASGFIFGARIVYLMAFLSGITYAAALWLVNISLTDPMSISKIIVPMIFYPAVFLLLARLVTYLIRISTTSTRDEAYDSFLALLSHQLIHPASTANAIIDQLEHTPSGSHVEIKRYINMLKNENNYLLQLLNNLLETSSEYKIAGEEEVDLSIMVKNISDKIAEDYGRSNDLLLDLGKTKVFVFAVKPKLVTALVNIINNAFQYSDVGSQVKVILRRSGTDALIVIEDKGSGISEAVKKQIFQKYKVNFDSKKGVKGLGLGLYVARKIIQAHNGSLHIFSDNDNMGTRVMIKLKRGKHHD